MVKYYAYIYNVKTGKQLEIGGTKESIKKDLKEMEKQGIVNNDCTINIYKVNI